MATARKVETKKGTCYEIQVSRGRGRSPYSQRWYVPDGWGGWSAKKKNAELNKQMVLFEEACRRGEVKSRAEKKQATSALSTLNKNISLRAYTDSVFFPAKKVTAATNTIEGWQGCCRKYIYPAIGDCPITTVSPTQISSILLNMQRNSLKHATVIKAYELLSLIFKMAYKQDLIEKNPMNKVDRPSPRKDEGKDDTVKSLSVDQVKKLLSIMNEEPLKWNAYIHLMLDTGMRKGECCAVQWQDLDLDARQLTVRHTLNYTKTDGITLEPPKNGKTRIVDFSEETEQLLRRIKTTQDAAIKSEYVFTQEQSSEPIHPQSPTRYLRKLGKKHGFENLHPHMLRHTHVSLGLLEGADVTSMSARIGHADPAFTLRQYSHTDKEGIIKAGEHFRKAIDNVICERRPKLYLIA